MKSEATGPQDRGETTPDPGPRREILVEGLYKSFGHNQVLRGIDLCINRGEMVALVGASGSGKTVLLKHMMGIFQPDRGSVCVADHESEGSPLVDLATLNEAGMDRLRRHWAAVFQKNALFSGTVYDNVALGLYDVKGATDAEIGAKVHEVMEAVGLSFEEVARMDRDQISGGMAKRVAIARALALDPVLMFYDEPTTGLDPARSQQIQDLITNVHRRRTDLAVERTTVIVTHDTALLGRIKPRIVMLHEGTILFNGDLNAFLSSASPAVRPYIETMPQLHLRNLTWSA
jgi:phospholipid/cholesterol/gamma-HCH transport system ATP-binding protein